MLSKFGHWWIVAGLLLGVGDLITTLIAGVENEMNPIVIYYLTHHGPNVFAWVKLSCVAQFMLAWRLFELFPQPAKKLFQILIVVIAMPLQVAVVANNLYWLLK